MSKNHQFDIEINNSGHLKEEHYTSPFVFSVAYLQIPTETKQGKTDYKSNDFLSLTIHSTELHFLRF